MNHPKRCSYVVSSVLCLSLGLLVSPSHAAPPTMPPNAPAAHGVRLPFATVGDEVILAETYIRTLSQGIRKKFYHGKVPEHELAKYQREVGSRLVYRILLLKEAQRRGIKPDAEEIARTIAGYDKRYANSPRWRADRDKMLPGVTAELETQSILTRLEEAVRTIAAPQEAAVRAYYEAHPEKFTEPMDQKVSLILLRVDPSAGGPAWEGARAEARKLYDKLKEGADFVAMAQVHSGDPSADEGGRLSYTHKGMLSEDVEKALEKIQPGDVTEPVFVLEGIAIFRLDSRTPPRKVSFEEARERAQGLLAREQSASSWEDFKKQLWAGGDVLVNEHAYYAPLPPAGKTEGAVPADKGDGTASAGETERTEVP